ncbi:MAG: hypothetical protein GTN99_00010, partial [Candidatus Dadabacteria bacterium]|nr:hypothetical protein [Candidatus Dadabacteria bacterium]
MIETPNFEEVKSTQNEITDVYARDDDGVSNREKIPQSGFDNISQQSSDSMFAAPAQPSSDSSVQTT